MATPTQGYTLNNRRVPSVTTIIGVGLGGYSKDALMGWAHREGLAGRDYKETRQKAADAGTLAHEMIERYLAGEDPYTDQFNPEYTAELVEQATAAFDAFLSWHRQHELTIDEQEVPLVCPTHRFGGTFDALGTLDGIQTLFDWKSSTDIYSSYPVQIAAYHWLIAQNRPHTVRPEQAVIVRCGKDGGLRVITLTLDDLSRCWTVFKHALAIYQARQDLEALVRAPVTPEPRITRLPVTRKQVVS